MEKSIPHIFHLYEQYGCINEVEEDAFTIAEDKVVYKLGPHVKVTEGGTKESSEDLAVSKLPKYAPVPKPRRMTTRQPRHEAESNR